MWGSMIMGNGLFYLNEIFGIMNFLGLFFILFIVIEKEVGEWWFFVFESNILEVGVEERVLVVERGDYYYEVFVIIVIIDGGWLKCIYKYSYNVFGGVVIIIGKEIGKLLYIGVRNKYCYVC